MSNSALITLNPSWFRTLGRLNRLYIARNDISDFQSGIFSSLTSLQQLVFYNNRIVDIRGDSFGPAASSLTMLYGSNNQINSIDISILDQARDMNDILLNGNQCTNLVHRDIRGNQELTRQLLADCSANFQANPQLSCEYDRMITGRIYWCRMTAVDPTGRNLFQEVAGNHLPGGSDDAVMYVQVLNQNTRTVPAVICRQFPSMQILDLLSSSIADLREDSFHGCSFLRDLTVMGNRIRRIPAQAFSGASNHLHELVLVNNGIEEVSVYAFVGLELQLLDLSHNRIDRYDPYAYSHVGSTLTVLRLTGNRIQSLPSHAFDNLEVLFDLELNGNQLLTIPHNTFIR